MKRLLNQRVVVTRAPEDAGQLAEALIAEGASPVYCPCIARRPPSDTEPLSRAWAEAATFDRVLVGSSAALEAFLDFPANRERMKAACVGKGTAARLDEKAGFRERFEVAEVASVRRAEGLVAAIVASLGDPQGGLEGRRFLFPRAPEGRTHLVAALQELGAAVEVVEAYSIECAGPVSSTLLEDLNRASAYTFLSGRTLTCFLELLGPAEGRRRLREATVAVIGPVAAEAAGSRGVRVDVMPNVASAEALVESLADHLSK